MRFVYPTIAAFAFLFVWLEPAPAHAELSRLTHTSGPALAIVLPVGPAIVGVRADYILQISDSDWRAAVHASLGGPHCVDPHCFATYAFGVTGTWGDRNRLFLEADLGKLSSISLDVAYTRIDSRLLGGSSAIAGYEFMAYGGFFFRSGLGARWLWEPALFSVSDRLSFWALNSFGHKLW